jgi:hypothetical protein
VNPCARGKAFWGMSIPSWILATAAANEVSDVTVILVRWQRPVPVNLPFFFSWTFAGARRSNVSTLLYRSKLYASWTVSSRAWEWEVMVCVCLGGGYVGVGRVRCV